MHCHPTAMVPSVSTTLRLRHAISALTRPASLRERYRRAHGGHQHTPRRRRREDTRPAMPSITTRQFCFPTAAAEAASATRRVLASEVEADDSAAREHQPAIELVK